MTRIFQILTCLTVLIFTSCSTSSTAKLNETSNCSEGSGCGGIRLMVKNTKSFDPSIDYARIEKFRVSISGPGIDGELSAEFPGDAEEGVIEGVPPGDDRIVAVAAINANDVHICEGEAYGISIEGGSTSDVDVTLESVPIFINLKDGAIVENTRLLFRVFAEPPGNVVIDDAFSSEMATLSDASSNLPEISLDTVTGVGKLAPRIIMPGAHVFTVRNPLTGRHNAVNVRLLDGGVRHPATFFSSSSVGFTKAGPTRRLGQAVAAPTRRDVAPVGLWSEMISTSE